MSRDARLPRGHWGNAHPFLVVVEDAVVLLHDRIAHDPQGLLRRWNVKAREGKEALASGIDDIVTALENKACVLLSVLLKELTSLMCH